MTRPLVRTSVVAFLAVLLGSCSGGGDDLAADSSTTSSTAESTTTSRPTTTSSADVTSTTTSTTVVTTSTSSPPTSSPGCGPVTVSDLGRTDAVEADVDGDGRPDWAFAVREGEGWTIVVELSSGGAVAADVAGVDRRQFVRVVGGADLMGAGSDDLVIVTGVGAYTEQVGFARLSGCDLFELVFPDSSPARFLTGASVSNGEALYCPGDGTLERYFFSAVPGSEDESGEPDYEGGFEPFRIERDRVVPQPGDGASLVLADVEALSLFDCLGLEL